MSRTRSPLAALLIASYIVLMLTGTKAQGVKGENGMKDPASEVQDRDSFDGCSGCSPSSLEHCTKFVWYKKRTGDRTSNSCDNCKGSAEKDNADRFCRESDRGEEDDLEDWVLKNCRVWVDCKSTTVQSSGISGTKKKNHRWWWWCDECQFVNLDYTCTYDYRCDAQLP